MAVKNRALSAPSPSAGLQTVKRFASDWLLTFVGAQPAPAFDPMLSFTPTV